MTQETKHGKLPFRKSSASAWMILGQCSLTIAQTNSEANSDFIIEACNSYHQLKEQNKILREALENLCPNSLRMALRDLERLCIDKDIESNDFDNAKMHITCELQRMEEALAKVKPESDKE